MNTNWKPVLEEYGQFRFKKSVSAKKVIAVVAALPLCTSWMFLLIPFIKGSFYLRI